MAGAGGTPRGPGRGLGLGLGLGLSRPYRAQPRLRQANLPGLLAANRRRPGSPPRRGGRRAAAPPVPPTAPLPPGMPGPVVLSGPWPPPGPRGGARPEDYSAQKAIGLRSPSRRSLPVSAYDPRRAPRRGGGEREGESGPRGSWAGGVRLRRARLPECLVAAAILWCFFPLLFRAAVSGPGEGARRSGGSRGPHPHLPFASLRGGAPLRRCPRVQLRAALAHHYGRRRAAQDPVSEEGTAGKRGALVGLGNSGGGE